MDWPCQVRVFGVAWMVAIYSLQTATAETILRCNELPTWEADVRSPKRNGQLLSAYILIYFIPVASRLEPSIITDHVSIAGSDGLSDTFD